jgi:hypothetical protein
LENQSWPALRCKTRRDARSRFGSVPISRVSDCESVVSVRGFRFRQRRCSGAPALRRSGAPALRRSGAPALRRSGLSRGATVGARPYRHGLAQPPIMRSQPRARPRPNWPDPRADPLRPQPDCPSLARSPGSARSLTSKDSRACSCPGSYPTDTSRTMPRLSTTNSVGSAWIP